MKAWVAIAKGCDITYSAKENSTGVSFAVRGKPGSFEFFFATEALRTFVELGSAALAEVNARSVGQTAQQRPG